MFISCTALAFAPACRRPEVLAGGLLLGILLALPMVLERMLLP